MYSILLFKQNEILPSVETNEQKMPREHTHTNALRCISCNKHKKVENILLFK